MAAAKSIWRRCTVEAGFSGSDSPWSAWARVRSRHATPARSPVLTTEAPKPGGVIIAMGADAIGKREISSEFAPKVGLVVAGVGIVVFGGMAYRKKQKD